MSRLPLRVRLTLVFALAMALVLAGVGAFVYVRVGDSLLEQVDERLALRADALAPRDAGRTLPGGEEEFAQVLDAGGDVAAATPGFAHPLLSAEQQTVARRGDLRLDAEVVPSGEDEREPARLLARPHFGAGVLVVGESVEDREEALAGLLAQLLVGGLLALALASAAGYLLAGAALRPVETMRRRAAEISAETSGERLPLPPARDELHRLGATLNAMIDRLDEGLRRERRFVADAGHELRTPLALLRTELELALRRPRSREELESALRSASDEVDRLERLAEELLLLASAAEPGLALRRSRFPVRAALDDVAARFAPRAAAAARAVEVAAFPPLELEADRLRIEQALGNLVDNALRHGAGTVTLDARASDGRVVLSVRDEGQGFPAELLGLAFERFSRGDGARAGGGAGLGLAIVDAVVSAHGGEARARNLAGDGAEVSITLPAQA